MRQPLPNAPFPPVEEIPSVTLPEQSSGQIESGLMAPTSAGAGDATQRERRKRKNDQACNGREKLIRLIVNDVRSNKGPPSHAHSAFSVGPEETTIEIFVKYCPTAQVARFYPLR